MDAQDFRLSFGKGLQNQTQGASFVLKVVVGIFLFLFSIYFAFFHHFANRDFWSSHEARAAMNANSILDGSSNFLPKIYDGSDDLQKPPFYYWLVATISRIRASEVDAISVRLPSAIAASGIIVLLFLFLWKNHDLYAGALGAVILLTCIHFGWLARIGRIDMAMAFFTTSSVLAFYQAGKSEGKTKLILLVLTYVSILISVLMKGLPALVLVLPLFAFWFFFDAFYYETTKGSHSKFELLFRSLRDYRVIPGLLSVVFLSWIYFYWINKQSDGKFYEVFFGYHHWVRALGNGALRSHPPWFYIYQFFIDFAPWSPIFYGSVIGVFCTNRFKLSSLHWFGLIWFLVMFFVLSLVSYKRADYLLPAYPGAAIFLAVLLSDALKTFLSKGFLTTNMVFNSIAILLVASMIGWVWFVDFYLPKLEPMREMKSAAKIIRKSTGDSLLFFNMEAHALAFHLGKPVETVVGWENLSNAICAKNEAFVLTSPDYLDEMMQNFPRFKFDVLYLKKESETKGLSRPFVFIKIVSIDHS